MFSLKLKELFLCVFMSLFTISCDDRSPTSSEEHTDADGFILEDKSGNEIYREFEGAITGSITISIGDTLELSVHFLDHNGNEIGHDDGEEEHDDELAISGNDSNIAIIDKRRPKPNLTEVVNLVGDLNQKHVLIIDDMIDTAGTICNAANTAIENGAIDVTCVATHPILSGKSIDRLSKAKVNKVIVCDTIEIPIEKK